jgi:hypothetical protein
VGQLVGRVHVPRTELIPQGGVGDQEGLPEVDASENLSSLTDEARAGRQAEMADLEVLLPLDHGVEEMAPQDENGRTFRGHRSDLAAN